MQHSINEKFLVDMRREIRDLIRDEIQRSLKFYSDKIDDYEEQIEKYEVKIKSLTSHQTDLNNKYKNIQMKYDLLEQKMNSIEQLHFNNRLEICGIQLNEKEDPMAVTKQICEKLKLNAEDIMAAQTKISRAPAAKKRNPPTVLVTLREGRRDGWMESSRAATLTNAELAREGGRIFLREALTPATSFLLWKAKTELRESNMYKFVWCKNGVVLIRKSENDKIQSVRSVSDIEKFKNDGKPKPAC
ncbi:uncharacterized protein LOC119691500 [Plutella xylostella]|nr:uncharacterized protein LOC119691500 [Plutella xylostella]